MIKIKQFINIEFESSPYATTQFMSFAQVYKKAVKSALGDGFEIVTWQRGHFYISAMIRNKQTKNLVYISCSDVRFFPNEWYSHILIRTAKHDKDWTGGVNNYTSLSKLHENAIRLTKEEVFNG
jgi:hypothetical protein